MAARGTVTSSRAGSAGTASVVTGTFPVGTVVGDRIAVVTNINNGTATVTATCGANTWTATHGPDDPVAATERVYLFERVLDATDVATGVVTFTWSGAAARIQCGGLVFPAGDTITPFGTVAVSTSAVNTATAPAFTTASPNADVYMIAGCRIAAGNFSGVVVPPAAFTEDYDVITTVATNANTEVSASHLTTPVAASSSVGGGSLTSGGAATHWVIYVNELRALVSVSTTRSTTWDTLAPVTPATRATTWQTAAPVAASRITSWVVRAAVAATRATSWSVLSSVTTTRATSWDVAAGLASVTTSRATTWTTNASVTSTRGTTWATRQAVAMTRATSWTVCTPVATTRLTTWAVLTSVSTPRATNWDTLASATALRVAAWDVKATVATTRATSWNVAEPTLPPQPTPPERTVGFTLPGRSGNWTLDDRTTSLALPSRTTSTTLGA